MRWRKPMIGDTRRFWKFLFLPRTIQHETRWLEWAYIEQQFDTKYMSGRSLGPNFYDRYWMNK